jgi:hypothetical protein
MWGITALWKYRKQIMGMANINEINNQKISAEQLGFVLFTVNASIERQIEEIKKEVDMFTDFLTELKKENSSNPVNGE